MENKNKKILVGAVTSNRHAKCLDEFSEHVNALTYPHDIFIVDNTENDEYCKILKRKGFQVHKYEREAKEHINVTLAKCRDIVRLHALNNDYDYLLFLDTDVIVPKDTIEILLKHDKDMVGLIYDFYIGGGLKLPSILKSGDFFMTRRKNVNTFDWDDVEKAKPNLIKTAGTGLGCCLIKRIVLENVPFRRSAIFICGEDVWFWNEANDKGYESWADSNYRLPHRHVKWNGLDVRPTKKLYFAFGPADATEAEIVS